jgi:hypothetical protein
VLSVNSTTIEPPRPSESVSDDPWKRAAAHRRPEHALGGAAATEWSERDVRDTIDEGIGGGRSYEE